MDRNEIIPPEKQRNPITQEAHRRQAMWQIYFPLILFGVFMIIAIVLAILLDDAGASKWADVSLIYILSLVMVGMLLTLVVLVVTVVYTSKLLKGTPYFFFVIQRYTYILELRVKQATDSAAEPFLRINSMIAGARVLRKK
jgi:K+-sensing histidine kinase KdpD